MSDTRLKTNFCELTGVKYPIVQTGMGWVAGPNLVTATCRAGALGILAAATLTFDEMVKAIEEIKNNTDNPFGVNLRTDALDIDSRIEHLIDSQVLVASFAQAPTQRIVERLKEAGVIVIPTVGAARHAEKVAELGVDAVIAQGSEGGGHTGVIPTSLLIPQVIDSVEIPVIAAGGFTDGRGLAAALAWGASGVAMGTRFLLTSESDVPENVKNVYLATSSTQTVVTKAIDGAPQRVISNKMVERLEKARLLAFPIALLNALRFRRLSGTTFKSLITEGLRMKKTQKLTWSQLALAANAPMLTKATMVDGHLEVGILPTGQGVGSINELPASEELVKRIIEEATNSLDRFGKS